MDTNYLDDAFTNIVTRIQSFSRSFVVLDDIFPITKNKKFPWEKNTLYTCHTYVNMRLLKKLYMVLMTLSLNAAASERQNTQQDKAEAQVFHLLIIHNLDLKTGKHIFTFCI